METEGGYYRGKLACKQNAQQLPGVLVVFLFESTEVGDYFTVGADHENLITSKDPKGPIFSIDLFGA